MYAMTDPTRCAARRSQRGLSIIEVMVGIVVALLVGLAASGSAMMFTASQRQGIAAGGMAVNATTALAALKNDAASAGLGFFGDSNYLCNRLDLSIDAVKLQDNDEFTPVEVTEDGTNDRIDVVYATQIESGANVLLNSASNSTSAELMSYLPAAVGQAVLLAPAVPGPACVVRSVTAVTAPTPTALQTLTFDNTGTHNKAAFAVAPAYAERDRIALLGQVVWHRYRLDGTDLVMERPIQGDEAILARNVMALRAQYGTAAAAAGSTTLESWEDATGATWGDLDGATLPRVRALRIGMVTRATQKDKPDAGGNCETTLVMPQLFGEDIVPDVADWQCYRYRTSVVVVPLRNLVLGTKT